MYCVEPATKKAKLDNDCENNTFVQYSEGPHDVATINNDTTRRNNPSPILENKERSFKKCLKSGSYSVLKRLSRFPRTILDGNVVESKFFSSSSEQPTENDVSKDIITIEESPEKVHRNPFKVIKTPETSKLDDLDTTECEDEPLENSQKENSSCNSPMKQRSPILEPSPRGRNPLRPKCEELRHFDSTMSEESVIENTYPLENLVTPTDSQVYVRILLLLLLTFAVNFNV